MSGYYRKKIIVYVAYDTETDDTGNANPHAETFGASRAESGNGVFAVVDEHRLHHEEVVVEGDDGVNQRYQHKHIEGC